MCTLSALGLQTWFKCDQLVLHKHKRSAADKQMPHERDAVKIRFQTIVLQAPHHDQFNNRGNSMGRIVARKWAISIGLGEDF